MNDLLTGLVPPLTSRFATKALQVLKIDRQADTRTDLKCIYTPSSSSSLPSIPRYHITDHNHDYLRPSLTQEQNHIPPCNHNAETKPTRPSPSLHPSHNSSPPTYAHIRPVLLSRRRQSLCRRKIRERMVLRVGQMQPFLLCLQWRYVSI